MPDDSTLDRRFFKNDSRVREQAETKYRVISSANRCALVECVMSTGVTHQIRSHLGYGLNCPVLGDHKYSDFLSFKPQVIIHRVVNF